MASTTLGVCTDSQGAEELGEEDLARHITREALIGVAEVQIPAPGGADVRAAS
jgi:hypothetical protein